MSAAYESVPVIHEVCNGQGCRLCNHTGEIVVRVKLEEEK